VIAGSVVLWRSRFIEYLVTEIGWPRERAEEHFIYATNALRSSEDILERVLAQHPALTPEEALAHLWFAGL